MMMMMMMLMRISYPTSTNRLWNLVNHLLHKNPTALVCNSSIHPSQKATWQPGKSSESQSGEHLVINLLRDQIIHIRQPLKSAEQF